MTKTKLHRVQKLYPGHFFAGLQRSKASIKVANPNLHTNFILLRRILNDLILVKLIKEINLHFLIQSILPFSISIPTKPWCCKHQKWTILCLSELPLMSLTAMCQLYHYCLPLSQSKQSNGHLPWIIFQICITDRSKAD